MKIKNKLTEPIQIITTAGNPHHQLKNRIEKINPNKIIIATDMDDQGHNFTQNEAMMAKFSWLAHPEGRVQGCTKQIIKTMFGKVKSSTPKYDAKDPAELLKKITERLK